MELDRKPIVNIVVGRDDSCIRAAKKIRDLKIMLLFLQRRASYINKRLDKMSERLKQLSEQDSKNSKFFDTLRVLDSHYITK